MAAERRKNIFMRAESRAPGEARLKHCKAGCRDLTRVPRSDPTPQGGVTFGLSVVLSGKYLFRLKPLNGNGFVHRYVLRALNGHFRTIDGNKAVV